MKKSENTTARPVRKTAEIKITGRLKGKIVKNLKAENIAQMWREIQKIWAISNEALVMVTKDGIPFMKLHRVKRGEKWWQVNDIVETRRSKGGKKYQAAQETAQAETVIPKITEETAETTETAETAETAEA